MSVEFEELMKAKDNPSEEAQSKSGVMRVLFAEAGVSHVIVTVSMLISDLVEFTDEEGYGRYLDLHDCYLKYTNLKGVEVLSDLLLSDSAISK